MIARTLFSALSLVLAAMPPAYSDEPAPVPVLYGGSDEFDACGASAIPNGLELAKPLQVRSGPAESYPVRDQLPSGASFAVCDETEQWLGIVYPASEGQQCDVGSPIAHRKPYPGPCPSGWVEAKFVKIVAG